jgi:hypothetical protein
VTRIVRSHDRDGAGWRAIDGLGRHGGAIAVLPRTDRPTLTSPDDIATRAPAVEYVVETGNAGEMEIFVEALPTHRLTLGHELLAAVSIDDGEPAIVRFDQGKDDENDRTWQANVLRGAMFGRVKRRVPPPPYALKLWAADAGIVVQRVYVAHSNADGRPQGRP